MKEINTDVLIVGSGLVGLVAAHCLSSLKYKVTLVDKKSFINSQNSFKDTRTVAVSEGSKIFLESLSLWGFLESYAEPIKYINVYDRSSLNKILFNNQTKNKKLGYVIENKKFSKILTNKLKKFKNTKVYHDFNVIDIKLNDKNSKAISNNKIINAKIIIAADGKNSQIKKIVGNITKINSSQIFPLSAHINDSFINKRLIYVGDSAHSIHPIAGQGWNLGVNDVKNLYELSKNKKLNIGSNLFCQMYNNKSYNKAFQLFQITDKLNSHFIYSGNIYRFLSNIGFDLLEKNRLLKNKITKYAMGI